MKIKKLLATLLAVAMVLSTMAVTVSADEVNIIEITADITLTEDIILAESTQYVIPEGTEVTIDLNNYSITGNLHKSFGSVIENYGTLILKNGTVSSVADNGGSALKNNGVATVESVTLNGAPSANGSWASYAVNNTGMLTINDSLVTGYQGGVASYGDDAVVTLNNTNVDKKATPGFTNHALYTYSNGKIIVNNTASNYIINRSADQASTGGSVINGAVETNGGTFTGRIENYYGNPVIYAGTFDASEASKVQTYLAGNSKFDPATGTVVKVVAAINGVEYYSLQDAFAAADDGDVIEVIADVVIDTNTRANNGGWWDGVCYVGDKDITLNLNGYTVTQDGSLNDYLLFFKNDGVKANTITIKNGTLDAGTSAFCAICTSTGSTQQITIDLEDVNLINNISNGATAKIRGGAVLNVKEGTVITGKDSYVGIEVYGSTSVANIYDGAELYQNGTSSYVGSLAGVSGGGTLNVYGGYGKSVQGGFIAMTSGGTINVYGGKWIANTDGTYANSNSSVLIAQSNKQYTSSVGNSVVNVEGGTFEGGYNCYGDAVGDAQLIISGGTFNADPSAYVADGYVATLNPVSNTYEVSGENLVANEISVVFEEVASGSEDEKLFNINLVATSDINEFASAEFTFVNTSKLNDGSVMPCVITAAENMTLTNPDEGYYGFAMDGVNKFEISGNKITIGQVRFTGYGDIDFNVASGIVNATTVLNNLVKTYTTNGAVSGDITKGDLVINTGVIDTTIAVPVRTLTINVAFPNAVVDNAKAYQDMKVEITGTIEGVQQTVTYNLGTDEVAMANGDYVVTEDRLVLNNAYTVTVSGAGYRTARYTVTMTEDKALRFWNNVMDEAQVVEIGKDSSAVNVTFLAGDIVKDNKINIYDLSAVVSYFGTENVVTAASDYAKYDLNRDGVIDSKDVAYVLVSWNN